MAEYLTPSEAAEKLSDPHFVEWYKENLLSKEEQYWNPDSRGFIPCDRCDQPISTLLEMRLMHARRLHHPCFVADVQEWIEKRKEAGNTEPVGKLYFERVAILLG